MDLDVAAFSSAPISAVMLSVTSLVDDDHLSARFVGFHDAMCLANLFKPEYARRLGLETTLLHIPRDLLERHIRQREPRRAEHEAPEESQADSARHLQERFEIGDGREPTQPPREARAATAPHSMASESRMVLLPTRSSTASICFASAIRFDRPPGVERLDTGEGHGPWEKDCSVPRRRSGRRSGQRKRTARNEPLCSSLSL